MYQAGELAAKKQGSRVNRHRGAMAVTACAVGLLLTGVAPGQAAVIVTTDVKSWPHANPLTEPLYTVADDDLLQTSATLTTVVGNFSLEGSGGEAVLTDGLLGLKMQNVTKSHSATAGGTGGTQLIYTLDTVANPGGYNISDIHVYGGWQDQNRDHQKWTVAYSTVADPDVFIDIATADFEPSHPGGTDNFTFVGLSSDAGSLAENVGKLRFTFHQADAGYNGYREIDVMGIGSLIPEPASMALLTMGGMAMAGRRRC